MDKTLIKDLTDKLPEDKRIKFIQACCSTIYNKNITIFFTPLFWTPELIEDYKRTHDGKGPIIAGVAGLQYDEEQMELYKKNDWVKLW